MSFSGLINRASLGEDLCEEQKSRGMKTSIGLVDRGSWSLDFGRDSACPSALAKMKINWGKCPYLHPSPILHTFFIIKRIFQFYNLITLL